MTEQTRKRNCTVCTLPLVRRDPQWPRSSRGLLMQVKEVAVQLRLLAHRYSHEFFVVVIVQHRLWTFLLAISLIIILHICPKCMWNIWSIWPVVRNGSHFSFSLQSSLLHVWLIIEPSYLAHICIDIRSKHTEITRSLWPKFCNVWTCSNLPHMWFLNSDPPPRFILTWTCVAVILHLFAKCKLGIHMDLFL